MFKLEGGRNSRTDPKPPLEIGTVINLRKRYDFFFSLEQPQCFPFRAVVKK